MVGFLPSHIHQRRSNPEKVEGMFNIPARKHAKLALDKIGARMSLAAYWGHNLMMFFSLAMPEWFIAREVRRQMEQSRKEKLDAAASSAHVDEKSH